MYTNTISKGIAKKIKNLYPKIKIEIDAVAANALGKIFVMVISSSTKCRIGGMRQLDLTFDVSYVCKEKDNMEYNDWLKNMYSEFEIIETDEANYRTKNMRGEKGEGIYHFIFDVAARYMIINDNVKMAALRQKGGSK